MSWLAKIRFVTVLALLGILPAYGKISPLKHGNIALRYAVGSYIGIDQNYFEGDLFVPLLSAPRVIAFGEFDGYRFDNGKLGFSVGVGARTKLWNNEIVGVNVYYDSRTSHFNKVFNRVGVGFEWIGCLFDARINGYFPVNNFFHNGHCHVHRYIGPAAIAIQKREFASVEGFDFELGKPFCFCNKDFLTYIAAGTYYYRFRFFENYWGGMARVNIDWRELVGLEMRGSYDKTNKGTFQAIFSISLPFEYFFGSKICCPICRDPMWQPVERNGIIFTKKCCIFNPSWIP
jgi:hypothetical protein